MPKPQEKDPFNDDIIGSFKEHCPQGLRMILNRSYIRMCREYNAFELPLNPITTCKIYSSFGLGQQLIAHQKQLSEIAKKVGIQTLHILPITQEYLMAFKKEAIETNEPDSWNKYLTFLYLL